MERIQTKGQLVPESLSGVEVSLSFAARMSGRSMQTLWEAIQEGRLRAVPYPAGETQLHWQVSLGDLADYIRTPLSPKWLAAVEENRSWRPGKEVRRVA